MSSSSSSDVEVEQLAEQYVDWCRIRDVNPRIGFPTCLTELLKQQSENETGLIDIKAFLTTIVSALCVESGLIPLVKSMPARSVQDLFSMDFKERMRLLVSDLLQILKVEKSLHRLEFKCIQKNDICAPDVASNNKAPTLEFEYKFSQNEFELIVNIDEKKLVLTLCSSETLQNVSICHENYMSNFRGFVGKKFSAVEFLKQSQIQLEKFSYIIKQEVIYPVLDRANGVSSDFRNLHSVPNEILEKISMYLDMRSVVKFSMINRRNHQLLSDNDEVWSHLWAQMPEDLRAYGIPAPGPGTLPMPENPVTSVAEMYRTKFLELRESSRHRVVRNPRSFFFGNRLQ